MKWTTATALFLALSAGGAGVAVVMNREPAPPEEVLANVRAEMSAPGFDKSRTLKRLAGILDGFDAEGNPELYAQLLRARADIHRDLGVWAEARVDLEQLRLLESPPRRETEFEIVELMAMEKQPAVALRRVTGLTEDEPEYGEAWALRGRLEESAATIGIGAAEATAARSLAQADAARAKEILDELTARDIADPKRDFLVKQLRDLFSSAGGEDLDFVLDKVGPPRASFKKARASYAKAMKSTASVDALVALSSSLEKAGRRDLAILVQGCARAIDSHASSADLLGSYVDDLMAAHRLTEAGEAVRSWDWQLGGDLDFYASVGTALFKSGSSREIDLLGRVATGMSRHGGETGVYWALYFRSIAPILNAELRISRIRERKDLESGEKQERISAYRAGVSRALRDIQVFSANEKNFPTPYLESIDDSWFLRAEAHRLLNNVELERQHLRAALDRVPDRSADAWIRLAETLEVSGSVVPWAQVEDALSHALDLAPERTQELAPRWLEAGNRALEAGDITLQMVINQATRSDSWIPLRTVGPSVMTRVAESHLANGHIDGAIRAAKKAREKYRNLIPPLDVIIAAELEDTRLYSPELKIMDRIEAAGVDERVEEFLNRLPAKQLDGRELVRAIHASPERFGKSAVADYFLAHGDTELAIAALGGMKADDTPMRLRLLRAELLVLAGRWNPAIAEVQRIEKQRGLRTDTALIRMRALVGAKRMKSLPPVARNLLETTNGRDPLLLEAVDLLALNGLAPVAGELLEQVDRRPVSRTPAFYRRRVLVDVLNSRGASSAQARESIQRSEAYLEDGTPQLGAILLAVTERDWRSLPGLVAELRQTRFRPTAYQGVALDLLSEQLEAGSRTAELATARAPRDPHWAFLRAAAEALSGEEIEPHEWCGPDAAGDAKQFLRGRSARDAKDPRDALALYLVANDVDWSPWVVPRVRALTQETGSRVWGRWVELLAREARGELDRRTGLIDQITKASPRFGPGHDLAIADAQRRHPSEPLHPELVRARRKRLASMGEDLVANRVEVAIARAGEHARDGDYVAATQQLQPVVRQDGPYAREACVMLGLVMIRAGQTPFAAEYLEKAALDGPGVYRDVVVQSLLYSIRHSIRSAEEGKVQRGAPTKEQAVDMLNRLANAYPTDPLVALARLQLLDVGVGERGVRARGTLERLDSASGRKTLDQLQRGCTTAWVEFLIPVAPDVAEAVVTRDLERQPGNLELWQLAGQVAEARGDVEAARRNYETLMRIDPRPRTGFALAELMIESGARLREVNAVLRQVSRAQGLGSVRETYLRALAMMRERTNAKTLDTIITSIEGLWASRDRTANEVDPLELGLLYVDALFRRAGEADVGRLKKLLAELEKSYLGDSLYEGDVLTALQGLRDLLEVDVKARVARAAAEEKAAASAD